MAARERRFTNVLITFSLNTELCSLMGGKLGLRIQTRARLSNKVLDILDDDAVT